MVKRGAQVTPLIHPVLLCGGSGTRLWPVSRKSQPKQFVNLFGAESLFQASARRLCATGFARPIVVTGDDFRFVVSQQLAALNLIVASVLIEPSPRNTAPAILVAALALEARSPGALMLVCPSDHVIPDAPGFRAAVLQATPAALAGQIVSFGITPDRAETGYGWLKVAEPGITGPQPLVGFIEKPYLDQALAMLSSGEYLWNAGIFLFTTTTILQAFATHAAHMIQPARASLDQAKTDLGFLRLNARAWADLPEISIDYAVMEKAENLSVMPYSGQWSDLGGWEAIWRESHPDADGVATLGPITAIDCHDTLLRAESDTIRLVGIGLTNIVAVATPDGVLIADKSRTQEVKAAVALMKAQGAAQAESFPRDFRPWGWFETIAAGNRFQVKRMVVHPGAALSLQSHHHRAEHWVVVQGTARVTVDNTVQLVSENQSVYVPLGARHRLENPGKVNMILIEVQTGTYLGEDDIIRYDDVYARGQVAAS